MYLLKDEKLQNVLGHFQKDFEGGVSAENLGKSLKDRSMFKEKSLRPHYLRVILFNL